MNANECKNIKYLGILVNLKAEYLQPVI